ncbi:hypothetical protein CTI14_00630 [Methylobacterium radiotolerans]|nr:hypothetical protein CTI14_00630 [Methylobacterium radiotolerans]
MQESDLDRWGDSYLPAWFDTDVVTAPIDKPRKPSAPRQSKAVRTEIVEQAESGIAELTAAKIKASATASEAIDRAVRMHVAETIARDRKRMVNTCLGQRNGILRCLHVLEGDTWIPEMTDRVRVAVDHILALSANASVLSQSKWSATRAWLSKNLPIIAQDHAVWLESEFERHLSDARAKLADRIPIRSSDYRTAPRPADIAADLNITTAILRKAKANKVGLTSIDPESKLDRDGAR